MELWNILSGNRLVEALGLTLMHTLWQGAAVALLLSLALLALRRHSAAIRYWTVLGAMATLLLGSAITFALCLEKAPSQVANSSEMAGMVYVWTGTPATTVSETGMGWLSQLPEYFKIHAPFVVALWLMGMFMLALKMLGGYLLAQRMRTYRTRPVPERWQNKLQQLANSIGISKSITLLESGMAKSPLTMGHFKPVVLMPLGLLAGLPVEQVEAILAHELAHIKRNDYLVNLVQSLVEIIFFYHPAIWWMGTLLHEEREHACDDLAIAAIGNRVAFAKALATIETGQFAMPRVAMGMAGRKGELLGRIQRILGMAKNRRPLPEKMIIASILILALFSTGFGKKEEIKEALTDVVEMNWEDSLFSPQDSTRKQKKVKERKEKGKEEVRVERQVYVINTHGKAPFVWHSGDSSKHWVFVSPPNHPSAPHFQPFVFDMANLPDSIAALMKLDSISAIDWESFVDVQDIADIDSHIWVTPRAGKRGNRGKNMELSVIAPHIKFKKGKNQAYSYEFNFDGMPAADMMFLDSARQHGFNFSHRFEMPDSLSEEEREAFEERFEAMQERLADLQERQMELAEERMEVMREQQIVIQERNQARTQALAEEGLKLAERGKELAAIGEKHAAEGAKLAAEGEKLAAIGEKRAAEGAKLAAEGKARAEAMQTAHEAQWKKLKEDLVADGLLSNKDGALKFYLDKEELRVNGQQASAALHQKYLKQYEQYNGQMFVISDNDLRVVIDMK